MTTCIVSFRQGLVGWKWNRPINDCFLACTTHFLNATCRQITSPNEIDVMYKQAAKISGIDMLVPGQRVVLSEHSLGRHFRHISLLLVLFVLSACHHDRKASNYSGIYTWGHEVSSFCPCDLGKCYWVIGDPVNRDMLRSLVEENTSSPYEGIAVTVKARVSTDPVAGFATDYDGVLLVESVAGLDESFCKVRKDGAL